MLPRMGRKVVLTTLAAIPVFALAWVMIVYVDY